MQNKQEKIHCGSGKKKSDTWLSVTINPDVIKDYVKEMNGNKYVKLNINIGNPNKYGKDVQITVDTWEPNGAAPVKSVQNNVQESVQEDDMSW